MTTHVIRKIKMRRYGSLKNFLPSENRLQKGNKPEKVRNSFKAETKQIELGIVIPFQTIRKFECDITRFPLPKTLPFIHV